MWLSGKKVFCLCVLLQMQLNHTSTVMLSCTPSHRNKKVDLGPSGCFKTVHSSKQKWAKCFFLSRMKKKRQWKKLFEFSTQLKQERIQLHTWCFYSVQFHSTKFCPGCFEFSLISNTHSSNRTPLNFLLVSNMFFQYLCDNLKSWTTTVIFPSQYKSPKFFIILGPNFSKLSNVPTPFSDILGIKQILGKN